MVVVLLCCFFISYYIHIAAVPFSFITFVNKIPFAIFFLPFLIYTADRISFMWQNFNNVMMRKINEIYIFLSEKKIWCMCACIFIRHSSFHYHTHLISFKVLSTVITLMMAGFTKRKKITLYSFFIINFYGIGDQHKKERFV